MPVFSFSFLFIKPCVSQAETGAALNIAAPQTLDGFYGRGSGFVFVCVRACVRLVTQLQLLWEYPPPHQKSKMELCALPTLFHFRWTSNLRKEARQFLWKIKKKDKKFQISHAVHLFSSHNMCLLLRIIGSISANASAWSVWSQRGQWKMLFVKRKIRKCSRLSHRNIHTSVPTWLTICLKMKHWSRWLRRLHFYHRKYKFIKKWINDTWIFNSECRLLLPEC